MEYLHNFRKEIIHRDLKSLNIFLYTSVENEVTIPDIRLADFGFARILEGSKEWPTMTRGAGSMHWMAPEVFLGNQYHGQADVFSFAIVTYEVVCRHMAFDDLDPDAAAERIATGYRPDSEFVPPDAPVPLEMLMCRCWSHEPDDRPTFTEIREELGRIQQVLVAG
jgi:serine/threonine protein kinase